MKNDLKIRQFILDKVNSLVTKISYEEYGSDVFEPIDPSFGPDGQMVQYPPSAQMKALQQDFFDRALDGMYDHFMNDPNEFLSELYDSTGVEASISEVQNIFKRRKQ